MGSSRSSRGIIHQVHCLVAHTELRSRKSRVERSEENEEVRMNKVETARRGEGELKNGDEQEDCSVSLRFCSRNF